MTYWILPWNKDVFNLPQCLQDFGFVEWRQRNKLSVGDIVFLYCSSPHRLILYMMRVSIINVGKNFIHVHHVEFISSFGGIEHEIEPINGLIPVCPNCRAMRHRKLNGKYFTPEELKVKIKLKA